MIPWWSTEFGEPEKQAVSAAIDAKHISQGAITRQFEERLAETLGVPYVVCTTSGTTALTMALLAVGIQPGFEVVTSDRTWIATVHAAQIIGAEIRLADVDNRGIGPIHFYGGTDVLLAVNFNGRLWGKLPFHGPIVEDSCQAFPNPPSGDIACYSLSVAKLISTGQGGFCATRDEALYKELKALRTHDVEDAMIPAVLAWRRFGYNFRFTDIQAAIGLAQLDRLPRRLEAIREIHETYKAEGVPVLETPTPLYNELLHVEPERLRAHLLAHEIEARPFYPPLHTAPYIQPPHRGKYMDYEFPNAMKFSKGLFLPSGPNQKIEDIKKVCAAINDFR